MPKVSVIIPNYNHAPFLKKRIDSVLDQSYKDFEVILMDDCSTDNSRDIIHSYGHLKNVTILINDKNGGSPFKQWNKGINHAKGKYIWIAESDDYAEEKFLETLIDKLDKHLNVGIVYCQSNNVDENDLNYGNWEFHTLSFDEQRWKHDYMNNGKNECENYMVFKTVIPNASAVLFRRSIFIEVGLAPENFRMCGDWLLWMKMLMISDIYYVAQNLNYFRSHSNTTRTDVLTNPEKYKARIKEYYKVLNFFFDHNYINSKIKNQVYQYLYKEWIWAYDLRKIFKKDFIEFISLAWRNDHFLFFKLIRFLLKQFQYKMEKVLTKGSSN